MVLGILLVVSEILDLGSGEAGVNVVEDEVRRDRTTEGTIRSLWYRLRTETLNHKWEDIQTLQGGSL